MGWRATTRALAVHLRAQHGARRKDDKGGSVRDLIGLGSAP